SAPGSIISADLTAKGRPSIIAANATGAAAISHITVLQNSVPPASSTTPTMTTITANTPNPSVVGQDVSVSVTVAANPPSAGTPTGTVTVSDGAGETCTVNLTAGAGSCSLTPTAPGSDTLAAHYNGDSNFDPGDAPGVSQTVNKA